VLKAENKKILQICLAATATLTLLIGIVPVGVIVVYASNDQNNNNDRNDDSPQNKACYNVGFADWQKNNPYSKTMFNQCGVDSRECTNLKESSNI
jgi:hypothetical protein